MCAIFFLVHKEARKGTQFPSPELGLFMWVLGVKSSVSARVTRTPSAEHHSTLLSVLQTIIGHEAY